MSRLRSLAAAAAGFTVAVLALAGPASPGTTPVATAQAAPTLTIDPGPLSPGATATAQWTGFTPNAPVYLYVCAGPGPQPPADTCFGDTLVTGQSDGDGNGSAQFLVRSALFPFGTPREGGGEDRPGGNRPHDCRSRAGCGLVVTQCSASLGASSTFAPYEVTPGVYGVYNDDPLVTTTWITDEDADGDGVPDPRAEFSRKPVAEPPEPPEEPPIRADGHRIRGVGSDIGGAVHPKWRRAIASQFNFNVGADYVDHRVGIDSVISGSADFAFSAAPADATQLAAAAAAGQSLVYVPISVSTIGVGYNVYPLLPLQELRMSASSVAGLLWPPGQPEASDLVRGSLAADQGECRLPSGASREPRLYTKAGRSEATITASSWLHENFPERGGAKQPWELGVIDVLENQDSAQQQLTHDKVPEVMANLKSSGQTSFNFAARFGLVDMAWARRTNIRLASIRNETGEWVQPSAAGALTTLQTSPIGADNIVDVDGLSTASGAYPMVIVNYAVAPTTLTADFTAEDADALRQSLQFMISTDGQRLAAEEGFVPLTADLTIRSAQAIAQIGSIVPAPPPPAAATTTIAPPVTTAAASPTTVRTLTTTPPNQPTPGATPRANSPGAAPNPSRASQPATGAPNVPGGPPAATPATGTSPSTGSSVVAAPTDGGRQVATAEAPEETPPDIFDSLFGAAPSAPDLPVLGAAGATIAVAGQGLNLWRVSRKRPRPPGL